MGASVHYKEQLAMASSQEALLTVQSPSLLGHRAAPDQMQSVVWERSGLVAVRPRRMTVSWNS